ncbi:hypothetical protein [Schinkia azotoformans]|uniref:hypothetical protein n=1 Tax=Schinkia azotoformans TaxID=1454 RepID=UPI002DBB754F|nr:hypothetical protein [Schinkia azotoformans]MEC1719052.1 hypothetical protein [Schinkia azotoformans]MED4413899.1 hypothetical protein [Schinkia azotoformans]
MFNLFRKKVTVAKRSDNNNNLNKKQDVKESIETIKLITLLDLIKHGDEINLNIKNEDAYEQGAPLAKCRILKLEGVSIKFSEWAEWTVTIDIHDNDNTFTVYKEKFKIDWDKETVAYAYKHSNRDIEVEWDHEGDWCEYISSTIHELKEKLDKHREDAERQAKLEKERQHELKVKMDKEQKEYFNQVFKNKR